MPVVVVEGDLTRARWTVGVDQVAGAAATQHLLDLGHTEIAHVAGPLDWTEAEARLPGWRGRDVRRRAATLGRTCVGDWTAAQRLRAPAGSSPSAAT